MKPETIKIRVASRQIRPIRLAVKASVNVDKIIDEWLNAHVGQTTEVSNDQARQWAKININFDSSRLNAALRKLYAIGYVLGKDMALYEIARVIARKAVTRRDMARASAINWDEWTPGNRAAKELVSPKGALRRLLDERNIRIQELNNTTVDRIGTVLGRGLEAGLTRDEIARDLRYNINELLDDPARATMIAQTEMSRAVVESNMDLYRESGVEYVQYLVADPCDECAQNEAVGVLPIGEEFPNGNPPVHPNCMCDLAPYVVDTENLFT
jgi:hypothetical protein